MFAACAVTWHETHCSWCACKGCGFCRHGVPCESYVPDDASVEKCEDFCDPFFAERHCDMCKCKSCGFCTADSAKGGGGTAGGANGGSSTHALPAPSSSSTPTSSSSKHGVGGIGFDTVGGGGGAACSSGVIGDASTKQCEKFCKATDGSAHCRMCKCQVCECSVARTSTPLRVHVCRQCSPALVL
jgi:hypothetical protein